MPSYEASVVIDAPATRVWPALADVASWPQWLPTVNSVEPLGAPTLALGSRFRIVQPKLRPAEWTVVELVPLDRFSWESRSPGIRVVADHSLRADTAGTTRVALRVTFSGPLAGLVGLFAGRLTREYLGREADALKRRVERAAA